MSGPRIRCAIYTRKSSDEGLEQEFNSLDAQHEACTAYIASQRHEGWRPVSQRYDDGGVSGGTLERPALLALLADIDAGRIDMVVVYKIDRLTRSLADFAKLVERLEAAKCSFVSVTQAFNTSSSMGRLTLNVLLSFAQFEREVTAERIRDKFAASKKKGLWMGGIPPLGYDPHPDPNRRELVVVETEAAVVRQFFALYAEHQCLNIVAREAGRLGLVSKRRVFKSGRTQGGKPLTRGQIHYLLTNPVYRGLIRHKDKTWPGLHSAIIDQELWDRVQDLLQSSSARRRGTSIPAPGGPAALKGRFRDETGDRLTPTHTRRRGKQRAYYVSNRLISAGADPTGWRLPAEAFEAAVATAVADHLEDVARSHRLLTATDAIASRAASEAAASVVARIHSEGITAVLPLLASGQILHGGLRIELKRESFADLLGLQPTEIDDAALLVDAPFDCRRRGVEMKIVAGDRARTPDPAMMRGLRHAHRWSEALRAGTSLRQLAKSEGLSEAYVARIIPLIGLSPKIQTAIIEGSQPLDLTLERLVRSRLPLEWQAQERMFAIKG